MDGYVCVHNKGSNSAESTILADLIFLSADYFFVARDFCFLFMFLFRFLSILLACVSCSESKIQFNLNMIHNWPIEWHNTQLLIYLLKIVLAKIDFFGYSMKNWFICVLCCKIYSVVSTNSQILPANYPFSIHTIRTQKHAFDAAYNSFARVNDFVYYGRFAHE